MRIYIHSVSERYAAVLEAQQARREFHEAYVAVLQSGSRPGSPEDYAMWSLGGYSDAAQRVAHSLATGRGVR